MLTIVASMEHEVAGLRRELNALGAQAAGPTPPVDVQVIGIGKEESQPRVRSLLERRRPSRLHYMAGDRGPDGLLLLGFAGAVDSGLPTGALCLSTRYYRAAQAERVSPISGAAKQSAGHPYFTGDFIEPDQRMWQQSADAAGEAGVRVSHLDSLTVDSLVSGAEEKASLGQSYPVGLVNMEDYWVAAAAAEAGVPFLSARVILDTANQTLPAYLPGLAGSPLRPILTALSMPWRIPDLIQLGLQFRLARAVLTRFALSYIQYIRRLPEAVGCAQGPAATLGRVN